MRPSIYAPPILYFFFLSLVLLTPFAHGDGLTLVAEKHSDYSIVLSSQASPSEVFAAEELQRCIHLSTAVLLPIIQSDAYEETPCIFVGYNPSCPLEIFQDGEGDNDEQAFRIKSVAPHLFIGGGRQAGTLYGVFHFLESFLGVRWYAPGLEAIPEHTELHIPVVDHYEQPAFQWRHTSYAWPGKDDLFSAHMRDNNGSGGRDRALGMQYTQDGRCHSYFRFISPEEYFDSHPEYFSEIGGVRRRHETQLCLTNPDVLEIVTEKMLARMKAQPEVMQHNFSQMDYYNYCECDSCSAINEKYGTAGGTQYWFLNQLAERTSALYPDKSIGTLAYMYTEEVPRNFTLHPNVAVWLCHMFPSCDSHSIVSCPLNEQYRERAKKWSALTRHLYIWHYVVNFAHYYSPFPNFNALAEDMRFYRDIGVEGIYLQGMGHSGGGGEFSLLRPWYLMKLAWNPDLDQDELLKDFLKGYYGVAWEPIYEYIALLQEKVDRDNIHMHLYTNPAQGYLPDDILEKSNELFDRAEGLAGEDGTLLEKLRVCRMPLSYARFFPRNGYELNDTDLVFKGPLGSFEEISTFVDRLTDHGFETIREASGDPQQLYLLGLVFNSPLYAPKITNDALEVSVVPFLGGRALRIYHKPTDRCITGMNLTRNLFFPFCGGEELRIGGELTPEGIFYQYEVASMDDHSLTIQCEAGGWLISRRFTLHGNTAKLTIQSTLQNLEETAREALLHSHSNLMLGEVKNLRVHFTDKSGTKQQRDASVILAGLREGEKYRDQAAPAGEWVLKGDFPLELVQRFDGDSLDHAWLYAYPEQHNDLECELWAKPVLLKKGESFSFTVEWEIRESEKEAGAY